MSVQQRPPESGSRVTIGDVARHAGVSPTTVSHVLSGKRLVGSATRERVAEAIEELGYRPNSAARQLRTKRSCAVAVLVPDLTNPFYSALTRGLADAVGGSEYGTYVCNTDGSLERERMFLHDVLDRGADGIVMASSANMPKERDLTPTRFGPPVVCIGEDYLELDADFVTTADRVGARAATAHLLARGTTRVAMIQGPPDGGVQRTLGYVDALNAAGHEPDPALQVHGDWTRPSGREAMRTLMAQRPRPDAVFCANDLMAIGAMDVIHELRLRVPDDVALVGFDDVDAATIVTPALTTVRNPAYDIGHEAGQLLLSRMRGEYSGPSRTVSLKCPLVERESG
ncbi:MAG: LacI family DNA-binding transcriptional regulator [Actinophytocola sp.]|nr:LacI family DNA-binding transcriptional regulator [Actinophytocola sp.]